MTVMEATWAAEQAAGLWYFGTMALAWLAWTVGFYAPDGEFHTDSDHDSKEEAAARCHYLNGRGD